MWLTLSFVDAQCWRKVWGVVQIEHLDQFYGRTTVDPVYHLQKSVHYRRQIFSVRRTTLQHDIRVLDVQWKGSETRALHQRFRKGRISCTFLSQIWDNIPNDWTSYMALCICWFSKIIIISMYMLLSLSVFAIIAEIVYQNCNSHFK